MGLRHQCGTPRRQQATAAGGSHRRSPPAARKWQGGGTETAGPRRHRGWSPRCSSARIRETNTRDPGISKVGGELASRGQSDGRNIANRGHQTRSKPPCGSGSGAESWRADFQLGQGPASAAAPFGRAPRRRAGSRARTGRRLQPGGRAPGWDEIRPAPDQAPVSPAARTGPAQRASGRRKPERVLWLRGAAVRRRRAETWCGGCDQAGKGHRVDGSCFGFQPLRLHSSGNSGRRVRRHRRRRPGRGWFSIAEVTFAGQESDMALRRPRDVVGEQFLLPAKFSSLITAMPSLVGVDQVAKSSSGSVGSRPMGLSGSTLTVWPPIGWSVSPSSEMLG